MLSDASLRETTPGSPEEFYVIHENLDVYVNSILKNLNIIPTKVSKLGGEGGANVKIDTNERSYVLKITPYDGILQVAEYFYRKCKEIGVAVPTVYTLDRTKTVVPFEYTLIEFINGISTNHIPKEKHFEAGFQVGETVKRIHSIVIEEFNEYIASFTEWTYDRWIQRLSYYITTLPEDKQEVGLSDEDINFINSLILRPELKISKPNLLHGDLHYENALFLVSNANLKLTCLIDPNTTFGDPMLDLAIAEVLSIKWNSPEFYDGLRNGYGELTKQEQSRVDILKVLFAYWLANWQTFEKVDASNTKASLKVYLDNLRKE